MSIDFVPDRQADDNGLAFDSAALLQALVDNSPAVIFVKDLRGRYALLNRRCAELFPMPIAGKNDYDLFDRERADMLRSEDRRVAETATVSVVEEELPLPDGIHVFHTTKWPLVDASGHVYAVCGMALDITERKRAEEALRRAQQDLRDLVDSLGGIICEVDVPRFAFTFVSPQAERLLGYPLAEWFATPHAWEKYLHPADSAWAINYCQRETHALRDHSFTYRMIAADGRVVWIRDIVTVISENGKPRKLRAVMFDITEEKLAEQRLREAQRIGRMGDWEIDATTRAVSWSEQMYELFERDPALGPPSLEEVWGWYCPDDAARLRQAFEEGVQGREGQIDVKGSLPSGRTVWHSSQMCGKNLAYGAQVIGMQQRLPSRRRRFDLTRGIAQADGEALVDVQDVAGDIEIPEIQVGRLQSQAQPPFAFLEGIFGAPALVDVLVDADHASRPPRRIPIDPHRLREYPAPAAGLGAHAKFHPVDGRQPSQESVERLQGTGAVVGVQQTNPSVERALDLARPVAQHTVQAFVADHLPIAQLQLPKAELAGFHGETQPLLVPA